MIEDTLKFELLLVLLCTKRKKFGIVLLNYFHITRHKFRNSYEFKDRMLVWFLVPPPTMEVGMIC